MTPARRRSPAQQPGRAQRRGGFGGLSRLRKLHDARKPKEPSAATRPSAAERGVRGSPPTSKTRRSPSFKRRQAQRPGRAQRRGGSGVSPDCENYTTLTRPRSRAQRRGGFGEFPDYDNTARLHAKRSRAQRPGTTHQKTALLRPPITWFRLVNPKAFTRTCVSRAKQKDVSFAWIFLGRGPWRRPRKISDFPLFFTGGIRLVVLFPLACAN